MRARDGKGVAGLAAAAVLAMLPLAAGRGGDATAAPGAPLAAPAQATPLGSGSLVINEVDYRQRGVDNAEFVELANRGTQTVNLGLFAVVGVDGSGQPYRRDRLPQRLLSPGDYFVLGSPLAANVDLVVGSVNIWRDPGTHPNQSAAVAVVMNPTDDAASDVLVDSVSYDGDVPGGPPTGGTWTEEAGVTAGDLEGTGQLGISRLPDRADTDVNSDDLSARCITPGYPNTAAAGQTAPCGPAATLTPSPTPDVAPPVLVVNEVDYAQGGNSDGDFVELKNVSGAPVALQGFQLLGVDGSAGVPQIYRRDALPAVTLPAGAYFVLGNSGVPNVDLDLGTQDIWTGGLGQGPRAIAVVANPGQDAGNDRLVDTVSYEGNVLGGPPRGGTWTETAGLTGGDPAASPFTGLSRSPDGQDSDINRLDFAARCVTPGYRNSDTGTGCAPPGTITPTSPASSTPTASITPTAGGGSASPTPTATGTPGGPPGPARFLVVSPADDDDAQPGDGRCETRTGLCTLRAALREALQRPGQDPVRIEFSGPMEIRTTAGMPLPDVARGGTVLTGAAHLRGGDPGVRILGPRRVVLSNLAEKLFPIGGGIFDLAGPPQQVSGPPMPGLTIGGPVTIQGLSISGFDVGIEVTAFAEGAVIGSDGDGMTDEREGMLVEDNTATGIVLKLGSQGNRVANNTVRDNRRHGVLLGRTLGPGNLLTRNRIYDNGGAAIAVAPLGPEVRPPQVRGVDRTRGIAAGLACPGCVVEVFGDSADEAEFVLGSARADTVGVWRATGLDLTGSANVTATARDAAGDTSRLSLPYPAGPSWRIVDVTSIHPRLLFANLTFRRILRVIDDRGLPVVGATLRFTPFGLDATTDRQGFAVLEMPLPALLDPGDSLALSLGGLGRGGEARAPDWVPSYVVARGAGGPGGGATLALEGLGPLSLGATFTGQVMTAREAPRPLGLLQAAEVYGAGMTVAPAGSREGDTAWQENLARGGALYEIHAPAGGAQGELRITAPVAAYDASGPASSCPGSSPGASIAGWNKDTTCWIPVGTTSASAPEPGASTFGASALVSVPGSTGLALGIAATGAYTLYTVGYDTTPPAITTTLPAGGMAELPEVVAIARDDYAGVLAAGGVTVTLDGVPLLSTYDPASGAIRLDAASRALAPGARRQLAIRAVDGFCNARTKSVQVRAGRWSIHLPWASQR